MRKWAEEYGNLLSAPANDMGDGRANGRTRSRLAEQRVDA